MRTITTVGAVVGLLTATAGAQTLVRDINQQPSTDDHDSTPSRYFQMSGGEILFVAEGELIGRELWKTDGTPGGAEVVLDIYPGSNSSDPTTFTELPDGRVLFFAESPQHGRELWITDGTGPGTELVIDLAPGFDDGAGNELIPFLGEFYFWGDDGELGEELYRTDGTAAGTHLVEDYWVGPWSIGSGNFAVLNDELIFASTYYNAIYKFDDSPEGVQLLKLFDGFSGNPAGFVHHDGDLFFIATNADDREIWRTDGTTAGTVLAVDVDPLGSSEPGYLLAANGLLWWTASTADFGEEVWVSDGTQAGTSMVKDIDPAPGEGSDPRDLIALDGLVLFTADDGTTGRELWATDGTEAGTVRLGDLSPGSASSWPQQLVRFGDEIVYRAQSDATGWELGRTDGTPAGTTLVQDIFPGPDGSIPGGMTDVGGLLLFSADDGVHGAELWTSDLTSGGTFLVQDLFEQPVSGHSRPEGLTPLGDKLFFTADDGVNGPELWSSDGTEEGTELLLDLLPGDAPPFSPWFLYPFGDRLLVRAGDETTGLELYVTDGTPAGTELVLDINPGPAGSGPTWMTVIGDVAYFRANDGVHGVELWRTDGTAAGTMLVKDIAPGSSSSSPDRFTEHAGQLFFTAWQDSTVGTELWKSDGTEAGTVLVKDIHPTQSSQPSALHSDGNLLFFVARDDVFGREPWISDGTEAGTTILVDLVPGVDGSFAGPYTTIPAGTLFEALGEVWISDGTTAGTSALLDVNPSSYTGLHLEAAGDLAFFLVDVSSYVTSLWVTNGVETESGPLGPVSGWQPYESPEAMGNGANVVFALNDLDSGEEPWISDGTDAGTELLVDVAPGSAGSRPREFTRVGDKVFFTADDGVHGVELHVVPFVDTEGWVAEPFGHGCPGTGGIVPRIGSTGEATLGNAPTVTLEDGLASTLALLAIAPPTSALELAPGCTTYVGLNPLMFQALTDGTGAAGIPIPIPDDAALLGLGLTLQWAVVDPAGFLGAVSLSEGLEVIVGL